MRAHLGKILFCGILGALALPFATAASLPDGATVRVGNFAFPQAAYTGAEEEAERLSTAFRNQLVAALQQTGLNVLAPVKAKDEEDAKEEASRKPEKAQAAEKTGKESLSDAAVAGEGEAISAKEDAGEAAAEKDELMALVEETEKAEKEQQDKDKKKDVAGAKKSSGKPGAYVITGTVTQYEEGVGMPVSTGKTRRVRAEVTLSCQYQVKDPAGKVIITEKTSASSTRVVAETVDIYVVLQGLSKKTFFDAGHNIAERVSGKTRVKAKEDAEPGSEGDEYADSPGKRLKSKSGQKKWIIN